MSPTGISPVSSLLCSHRSLSRVRLLRSGIVPPNGFLSMISHVTLGGSSDASGTPPVRSLFASFSLSRLVMPLRSGTVPLRLLPQSHSCLMLDIPFSHAGI